MRNQRAGRATFLPLDTITTKPVNDKFRSFAKGARLAIDVITFDPSVERAMHHVCGNSLICDSMEVARHVCFERNQEVKGTYKLTFPGHEHDHNIQFLAVTLEGAVIHKSGQMTGGANNSVQGRKWEEKDIQSACRNIIDVFEP
jgi:structural maintenance of chromosome 1